jgi:hypothetical protein
MAPVTNGTIIVKPRNSHGWTMVTARSRSEMFFQTRERALQFARAYARLNPPATIQIFGVSGQLEAEETFADTFRGGGPEGDAPVGLRLVTTQA